VVEGLISFLKKCYNIGMPTGKLILTGLLLWLIFCHSASADLYFKMPQIANFSTSNLEWGASPRQTIYFKNTYGKNVYITDIEFNLYYNASYIDSLINFKCEKPDQLMELGVDYLSVPGLIKIQYKARPGAPPLVIENGATADLLTITYHLTQSPAATPIRTALFKWAADHPSGIYWSGVNVAGTLYSYPAVTIYPPKPPSFNGLNSLTPFNAFGQNLSRTVSVDWRTSGSFLPIHDKPELYSTTPYETNEWHYKVYRKTDDTDWILISPDTPVPYTGNVDAKYVFEDSPRTTADNAPQDGTLYYYKVAAVSDLSPNPMEIAPITLTIRPGDRTAPAAVSNLSAISYDTDKMIKLRWTNPNNPDLAGIAILRSENSGPTPILEAGREYFPGQNVGVAQVAYFSPTEVDLTLVPQEYDDFEVEYNKTYYFWVFAFDGSKNYSTAVTVRQALGQPPAYEIPPMEGLPYGEFTIIARKLAGGPGINTFTLPYPLYSFADAAGNPVDLSTLKNLVLVLDQGKHYIRSLGWWDENLQQPMGISKIEWSGTEPRFTFLPGTNADTPVQFARAYQMTVSDPNNPEGALNYVITFKIIQ